MVERNYAIAVKFELTGTLADSSFCLSLCFFSFLFTNCHSSQLDDSWDFARKYRIHFIWHTSTCSRSYDVVSNSSFVCWWLRSSIAAQIINSRLRLTLLKLDESLWRCSEASQEIQLQVIHAGFWRSSNRRAFRVSQDKYWSNRLWLHTHEN